ncbi:synaptopodin 2-like protein [Narcine bancroftii]|uniref:synaptopodin 2-like protein n=1 Tax=Narcine bancroftii TaxID=1343680 RepID=UPI003831B8B9
MGSGKETLVTLSGRAPWGFRLHGGSQQNLPLRVAKVRKRGKACRGGLRENDILLTINGRSCSGISHADAMNIIDSSDGTLHIWVKRISCSPTSGSFQSETSLAAAPCARSQDSSKAPRQMPEPPSERQEAPSRTRGVRGHPESYTSPPDSEAYYGETDSDADHSAGERQRRQKKRWPGSRTLVRGSAEEASEQSEYDSAPEPVRSDSRTPLSSLSPEPRASNRLDPSSLAPAGVIPRMFQPRKVEAKMNIWQPKVERATYCKPSITHSFSAAPSLTHPTPSNPTSIAQSNSTYPNHKPITNPHLNSAYPNTWSAPSSGEDGALRQGILGTSEADSGFQEVPPQVGSPERKLLPTATLPSLRETQLVPMVGPVNNPVDEVLTTTYREKAKQAKLHRSESVQEKQAKEARTKCKTIASLLTSAPNPHSKGVLMFKKRRQRAKKYTLVSYGSVDEEKQSIDEDGELLPTSESEFDEEAFSDAKSWTNQSMGSDWDSSYLDIEKPKSEPQGLTETKGKGVVLFEHQRQRATEYMMQEPPTQTQCSLQMKPKTEAEATSYSTMNGDQTWSRGSAGTPGLDTLNYYTETNLSPRVHTETSLPRHHSQHVVQGPPCLPGVANWTARPFTPGFQQSHTSSLHSVSAPVLYQRSRSNATPLKPWEQATGQNKLTTPFSPPAIESRATVNVVSQPEPKKSLATMRMENSYSPPSAVMSPPPAMMSSPSAVMSPPPVEVALPPMVTSPSHTAMSPPPTVMPPQTTINSLPCTTLTAEHTVMSPPPMMTSPKPVVMLTSTAAMSPPRTSMPPGCTVASPTAAVMSPPSAVMSTPPSTMTSLLTATPYSTSKTPVTSTATFRISSTLLPQRECEGLSSAAVNIPSIGSTSSITWTPNQPSESLATREQRISVPASKTGILQDARRRSTRKPMFTKTEEKKTSPNPELLSLVQNLDEKKPDHMGAGFESGPEEDVLSLGAEASNFMQPQACRQNIPPPVAPKPYLKTQFIGIGSNHMVNGTKTPATLQLKGKGAELFAKRQSRMDRFIIDSVPTHSSQPRGPSPTPSLPATWKYSPNIRAPPPIGYNPIHTPSYPLAASKSQAAAASNRERKWIPGGSQKAGIKAIDFMRRQPYQLNPAMFSFDESNLRSGSAPTMPLSQQSFISTKHIPVKTPRACEIKRFSTPVPNITPTVIAPRSATTLAEPVWMSAPNSPPPVSPKVSHSNGLAPQYGRAPRESSDVMFEPSVLQFSPIEEIQVQKKSPIPVPRPRFSAVRGGSNTHTWRPGSLQE